MTTIIVTRPVSKQQAALETFQHAGFEVLSAPCFESATNNSIKAEWIVQAAQAEVLVVLNSHAIDAILDLKNDFQVSSQTQVLAIGAAVAAKWQHKFSHPITHAGGNSEAVINCLIKLKPKKISVLTASGGRELIKSFALKQGISYLQLNCYARFPVDLDVASWQQLMTKNNEVVLTANSGDLLKHIKTQLPEALWLKLLQQPLVTGADRISLLANELGFFDVITAKSPSNQDMLAALIGA